MNRKTVILISLLMLLSIAIYYSFKASQVERIGSLTYRTGEAKGSDKKSSEDTPRIRKDIFPPKRESFRIGNQGVFRPLGFQTKKKVKKTGTKKSKLIKELLLSPGSISIEVGSTAEVTVDKAEGTLTTLISPPGMASANGTASPLTFICNEEGSATAQISDGKASATLQVVCRMRPQERQLADFIFLGFMAKEKEKTIFLSRVRDNEIFIVKKGDVIIKKSATITQNYFVKEITDEKIIISSADGADIMEIGLTENEPLRKDRKE